MQYACTQAITLFTCLHFGKGQIISKGLFGILGFFQKTNEHIHFWYCQSKKENSLNSSYFGKIRGCRKLFRNNLTFSKLSSLGRIWTHRWNLGDLRKDEELEGIMWPSRFSIKLIVFADLEIRLVGNNGLDQSYIYQVL